MSKWLVRKACYKCETLPFGRPRQVTACLPAERHFYLFVVFKISNYDIPDSITTMLLKKRKPSAVRRRQWRTLVASALPFLGGSFRFPINLAQIPVAVFAGAVP